MKKKDRLPIQRERFCCEYVKDFNATQAAIRAGYSKRTAKSQGNRLLTYKKVKARIQELCDYATDRSTADLEEIIMFLTKCMRFDMSVLYDEKNALKSIENLPKEVTRLIDEVEFNSDGTIKRYKMQNKLVVAEKLIRYFGGYYRDNNQKKTDISQVTQFKLPENGR